jgi:hypothetical protein
MGFEEEVIVRRLVLLVVRRPVLRRPGREGGRRREGEAGQLLEHGALASRVLIGCLLGGLLV